MPKIAVEAETVKIYPVSVPVPANHRLLVLKRVLNWGAITEIVTQGLRDAGRNIDGARPGRRMFVQPYPHLIVLMLVLRLDLRSMEAYLAENAVGRSFMGLEDSTEPHVRDHSTIGRLFRSLGADGLQHLNQHINQEAVRLGFAHTDVLSADTTAQELSIGYPHEPGILRGVAERCLRAYVRLKDCGRKKVDEIKELSRKIIFKCKEHHLFAKTAEKKTAITWQMVSLTRRLMKVSEATASRLAATTKAKEASAVSTLKAMQEVTERLLPQIESWLTTSKVAAGKILHAGLPMARAIVRNKIGKKVEFGLQYLIASIRGGYLMGSLISRPTGETKMPALALSLLRDTFGASVTPEMFVYDRGGSSRDNVKALRREGVKKIGIQPKGRARWHVHGPDRHHVMKRRAEIEGKIGTLRVFYGMNKPKERRADTVAAVGPRSILSFNLNKFCKDVTESTRKTA
jgi:hypothetical protein